MKLKTNIQLVVLLLILPIPLTGFSQDKIRISGFIRDTLTRELLIGANINQQESRAGTSADNNGYFSMVTGTPVSLTFSYVGYISKTVLIDSPRDTLIQVSLEPGKALGEVVISATRTPKSNVASLSIRELSAIPSLGSKPDILKSMQLLPGIQSQNEGTSRLLVRGGDPGQNLYLFDNTPVIYVNHIGGFMSVFNPDIINTIDIYKGGFPARFGGRLSSVVDIAQREGDRSSLKGSVSIGITDASFAIEGPLKLKNSNFIVTGRKTLYDPYFLLASKLSAGNNLLFTYGFYDLNGKFTWRPDDRNSFHLNIYQGDDYLQAWSFLKESNKNQKVHIGNMWGNWLVSGRWNRVLSPRVFLSNSLSYSRYRLKNNMSFTTNDTTFNSDFNRKYLSVAEDLAFRSNTKFQLLKAWTLDAGLQASLLHHSPNDFYQSNLTQQSEIEKLSALESALYLDNKISLTNRIEANLGARLVNYSTTGYSHFSFEPRVNINIGISDQHQLNLSYMRVTQNAHLLVTSGSIMSNEVWVPADSRIPPALSDQLSVGWNGFFHKGMFQTELSVYYKTLERLTTYKEGYTNLMGDADWRSKIISGGTGKSVGIEFLIRKVIGDWTGFASYAWSRTTRQYPDINGGNEYLFEFNRPHTASLNISHKFNEKWAVNLSWVYQSGLPYTPVVGRQLTMDPEPHKDGTFDYYEVLLYGERNSARMKDYHRLDIGVTLNTLTRNNRKATWTFSVYNLYNRHNPYYYYYNTTANGEIINPAQVPDHKPMNLYQMSFFPIIPSVSYKVYFDKNTPKRIDKSNPAPKKQISNSKWNMKASFASYPGVLATSHGFKNKYSNYRIETNYRVLDFMEINGYLGYSRATALLTVAQSGWIIKNMNVPFAGTGVNLQLLPLIMKNRQTRSDLYLLGRYGGVYYSSPDNYTPARGLRFQYQHGGGIAFYLTKHIGLFGEYSFGNLGMEKGNLRYGLSIKF